MREMILRGLKGREIQGMAKEMCKCTEDGTQREAGSCWRAQERVTMGDRATGWTGGENPTKNSSCGERKLINCIKKNSGAVKRPGK